MLSIRYIMSNTVKKVDAPKKVSSNGTPNGAKSEQNEVLTPKNVDEILNPTPEGRISRMKTFEKLSEKYQSLTAMQEDLDIFRASLDQRGQRIKLESMSKTIFEVGNPDTFKKVLEVVVDDLAKAVNTTKEEILNFQL